MQGSGNVSEVSLWVGPELQNVPIPPGSPGMPHAAKPLCEIARCELLTSQEDPQQPGIFFLGRKR